MRRNRRLGTRTGRAWLHVLVSLLFTIGLLLPGSTVGADDPIPTPTPGPGQPVHIEVLPSLPTTLAPELGGQGPYVHLTNYTFDPLSEPTPPFLPTDLTLSSYPPGEEGYYLLQFHDSIQPAWKAAIAAAGAQVFDYIPDFTFVVKMDDAARAAVEDMEAVRWVGLYQPGYRIASSLMDATGSTEGAELVDVMVIAFRGEDVAALAGRLQEMGGTILDVAESHWKGKVRVQIPPAQIDAVAHLSGVKWIEPAPEWELYNNEAADILDVRDVWDTHGLHGAGQIVAVCDSGLDQGSASPGSLHDDFEDGSGGSRVVAIYDRVGDGADDVNSGHGTHVSGSVLGNGDRSGSTPSSHNYPSSAYVGMAPEASLVFQAVEQNSTGSLSGIPSDLNTLFSQVLGDGARIHTNSWGAAAAGAYTSSSEDVDEFVWDHKDFTVLFAAGNEGIDNDADGVVDLYSTGSPGTAKNCITVGATENDRPSISNEWGDFWPGEFPANPIHGDRIADDPDGMAAFSSRGSTLDGRFKPDVVAPGTYIASVRSSAASGGGWGTINSYYMYMGGTSMATPLVAGTAALVREHYTDNEGITPSGALVKATLVNGATDISPGQYGTGSDQEIPDPPRPNDVEGWGRVSVENAIFPTALIYDDQAAGLSTGEESVYSIQVTDSSEPLRVTLAWSDYPGSPAAAGGLVNDLDLSVTAPGGTVYYPNNASQRGATQYLQYDSTPYYVATPSSGEGIAVKFTPTSYPVQLDRAVFFVYASSYPTTFTCNVWDDDGSGGLPGTNLLSKSVTARGIGWLAVDISGVTITSGDFYVEMRFSGINPRIILDGDGRTTGRNWYYDGSSWDESSYTHDFVIRAAVAGSDHSTSFDRVNNVVGVDIDSPATGVHTITVRGHNVPYGPQPYALVASGAIQHAGNSPPVIAGLPDQTLLVNTSLDNGIDLWAYTSDFESPDSDLTFSIDNTPDSNAGVTLDSNRYIDINPTTDWTGQTDVVIRVADPGGLSDTDSFQVTVTAGPSVPFCDGFESGSLGIGWTTYTTNEGRVQVSSSYPHSGTYSVLLDDSANNATYSYAAIILTIDLSGESDVDLDFWWRDFVDEDDADDGVFLSDDGGTTWITAMNFTGSQSSFKNEVVDLDDVAAANGLTLNDQFQIKFQFYDNYGITTDGYAIDDVCVYGPPDIGVVPTSFEETMAKGGTVTRTLTIGNAGMAPLSFNIYEAAGGSTSEGGRLSGNSVLLMGDDVDAAGWDAYRDALTAAGQAWDEWDLDVSSFPTATALSPYGVLIWFDESMVGPGNSECQVVADWLTSGGKALFVTSVDFLWDLENGTAGQGEHNLYQLLNTEYLASSAGTGISALEGVSGDPVGGDFVPPASLGLTGSYDSSGDYADEAVGARTGLIYGSGGSGSTHSGLTHYEGDNYKTVWLGVNFHNGLASQAERNQLMENILDFVAGGASDVPWLSEEPTSGTVAVGGSLPVDVILDATGLTEGDYTADLLIYSNDPDESPVTVPVVMHVSEDWLVYLPLVVRSD